VPLLIYVGGRPPFIPLARATCGGGAIFGKNLSGPHGEACFKRAQFRRLLKGRPCAFGCDIVDTFTEVETGKGADALERRPQLAAALKMARRLKCPIVVSKRRLFGLR
jgi:hypothetical protein